MVDLAGFQAHLKRTSSPSTAERYRANVEEFLAFLSDRPPTINEVEEWVVALQNRNLRPQTLHWKMAAVKRYLGYLARHGDTIAGQTLSIMLNYRITPSVREQDIKPKRVVSREEARKLMARASTRDKALIAVLWGTGARISEVLGNHISQIRPMMAEELKQLADGQVIERPGKGGRVRRLVLLPHLRNVVGLWGNSRTDGQPAFPISQQGAHKAICRLARAAKIPRLSPHAFRHGYKTVLETHGVPREVLKALLGHGPRDVTDVYGEVRDTRLKEVIEQTSD